MWKTFVLISLLLLQLLFSSNFVLAQEIDRPPDAFDSTGSGDVAAFNGPTNALYNVIQAQLTQTSCLSACFTAGRALVPPLTLYGIYSPLGCAGTPVTSFPSVPLIGTCCCY